MTPHESVRGARRWSELNAALTLLCAGVSVCADSPLPLVATSGVALLWVWWRQGSWSWANAVTASRFFVLALAVALFDQPAQWVPFALTAWLLDGVDGWLARRRRTASAFGAQFDMETDAHLVMLLCLLLKLRVGLGAWVLLPGALRYLLVLARFVARTPPERERAAGSPERRSEFGRWVFSFSYLSLVVGLLPAVAFISVPLLVAALGSLLVSFAPDFWAVVRPARIAAEEARP
jgi:phosphatidylglycerophosphate synthase